MGEPTMDSLQNSGGEHQSKRGGSPPVGQRDSELYGTLTGLARDYPLLFESDHDLRVLLADQTNALIQLKEVIEETARELRLPGEPDLVPEMSARGDDLVQSLEERSHRLDEAVGRYNSAKAAFLRHWSAIKLARPSPSDEKAANDRRVAYQLSDDDRFIQRACTSFAEIETPIWERTFVRDRAPDREWEIFRLHFLFGQSQRTIANFVGLTQPQVNRIINGKFPEMVDDLMLVNEVQKQAAWLELEVKLTEQSSLRSTPDEILGNPTLRDPELSLINTAGENVCDIRVVGVPWAYPQRNTIWDGVLYPGYSARGAAYAIDELQFESGRQYIFTGPINRTWSAFWTDHRPMWVYPATHDSFLQEVPEESDIDENGHEITTTFKLGDWFDEPTDTARKDVLSIFAEHRIRWGRLPDGNRRLMAIGWACGSMSFHPAGYVAGWDWPSPRADDGQGRVLPQDLDDWLVGLDRGKFRDFICSFKDEPPDLSSVLRRSEFEDALPRQAPDPAMLLSGAKDARQYLLSLGARI